MPGLPHFFDGMDPDRSGTIEYAELNKLLRSGANVELAADLKAGARGTIETKAKNKSTRDLTGGGPTSKPATNS